MIESIFTLIFVLVIFILGILAKRILYVDEHVQSIQDELNTFNDNLKSIENIDLESSFKLGSGHVYQNQ